MHVALVNTNRIVPPIAPIGLDYVAESLNAAGHRVELLDLCWEEEWDAAILRILDRTSCDLVGVTLRNTDDCAFTSRQSFLAEFAEMAKCLRGHTDAPIVLGGVGSPSCPSGYWISARLTPERGAMGNSSLWSLRTGSKRDRSGTTCPI